MQSVIRAVSAIFRRVTIGPVPKLFDAGYYLRNNSEANASGIDPYLHYVWYGARADYDPAEDFDAAFYRQQSGHTRLDPIRHYMRLGVTAGLDPNPDFSTTSYLVRYPDIAAAGSNPLLHYRTHGRQEGREARPSASKLKNLVALEGVSPRHVHTLPDEDGAPFSIQILPNRSGSSCGTRVQRLCFLLKLTQDEIALLIEMFRVQENCGLSPIAIDVIHSRNHHPSINTVLAAFDRCYVENDENKKVITFSYSECRLWDLRQHAPRVAEIFASGAVSFQSMLA